MNKQFNISVFSLDAKVSKFLEKRLSWLGFNIYLSSSLKDFWFNFYYYRPDLVIIDDSIGNDSILNVFKKLNHSSQLPILFLAYDYSNSYVIDFFEVTNIIVKPFSLRTIDFKILSILNNKTSYLSFSQSQPSPELSFHLKEKYVTFNESRIYLTKTEFKIFSILLSEKGEVCNKAKLLENVWGYEDLWSFKSNLLEMHFSKLKKKLTPFSKNKKFLRKKNNQFLFRS
jgi:DNA-binding response OmpR family regulator